MMCLLRSHIHSGEQLMTVQMIANVVVQKSNRFIMPGLSLGPLYCDRTASSHATHNTYEHIGTLFVHAHTPYRRCAVECVGSCLCVRVFARAPSATTFPHKHETWANCPIPSTGFLFMAFVLATAALRSTLLV